MQNLVRTSHQDTAQTPKRHAPLTSICVQRCTRPPLPDQLTIQTETFVLLQTQELVLSRGQYILDLIEIHVPMKTLELIFLSFKCTVTHMQEFMNLLEIVSLTENRYCTFSGSLNFL